MQSYHPQVCLCGCVVEFGDRIQAACPNCTRIHHVKVARLQTCRCGATVRIGPNEEHAACPGCGKLYCIVDRNAAYGAMLPAEVIENNLRLASARNMAYQAPKVGKRCHVPFPTEAEMVDLEQDMLEYEAEQGFIPDRP